MNPVRSLADVARKVAALGEPDLAERIRKAAGRAVRLAATTEIVLDSWTEFESWLLKNRSQGLVYVFEDKYGQGSKEVEQVQALIEGYDLIERQAHELYETLRAAEQPQSIEDAPVEDDTTVDDIEAADATEEESLADVVEEVTEPGAEEEPAAEEVVEEAAEGEEAADGEEAAEGDEAADAAEEALAPAKAEASVKPSVSKSQESKTPEAKTIARLSKLLTKAKVVTSSLVFAGNNSYRVQFPDVDTRQLAIDFFKKAGMATDIVDHPVKVFLTVTP